MQAIQYCINKIDLRADFFSVASICEGNTGMKYHQPMEL